MGSRVHIEIIDPDFSGQVKVVNGEYVLYSEIKEAWYKDYIGETFDVKLYKHVTFNYLQYILEDTERNRNHFKGKEDEELWLIMLEHGHWGIFYNNAVEVKVINDK